MIKYDKQILAFLGLFSIITVGETFTVKPKKKQPKITAQDCCDQLMSGLQTDARIAQYQGNIQSIELGWAKDFLDDVPHALFKDANQDQLQDFYNHKKKCNVIREEYEKALREERDYLKQFEQTVMKNKK